MSSASGKFRGSAKKDFSRYISDENKEAFLASGKLVGVKKAVHSKLIPLHELVSLDIEHHATKLSQPLRPALF